MSVVWVDPNRYADLLKQFKFVLAPDFSQYLDMPRAMRVWNHYRKMWLSSYWQKNGVRVIPVAGWTDEASFDYCFDGMPKNSCIATSSVGVYRADAEAERCSSTVYQKSVFRRGTEEMIERLTPTQLLWYGSVPMWAKELTKSKGVPLIRVPASYEKRFKKGES